MSCKHGDENWMTSPCPKCVAEAAELKQAYEAGKKEGWESCESCHGIEDGVHLGSADLQTKLTAAETLNTVIREIAEELGCEADNEKILETIAAKADELAKANGVILAIETIANHHDTGYFYMQEIANILAEYQKGNAPAKLTTAEQQIAHLKAEGENWRLTAEDRYEQIASDKLLLDEKNSQIENLSAFINRLCRQVNKFDPGNKVTVAAAQYMHDKNLLGTSLRKDDEGIAMLLAKLKNRGGA